MERCSWKSLNFRISRKESWRRFGKGFPRIGWKIYKEMGKHVIFHGVLIPCSPQTHPMKDGKPVLVLDLFISRIFHRGRDCSGTLHPKDVILVFLSFCWQNRHWLMITIDWWSSDGIYLCMHICMYMCIYTYVYIHMYIYICILPIILMVNVINRQTPG